MILKEFYTHLYSKKQKGHISDYHPAKAFVTNEGFSKNMIKYAIGLAEKHAGNMTKAVKLIDKIKKGLSNDPKVKAALQAANESVKEVASPLISHLNHAKQDVNYLIDAVYSNEADDAFENPKMSKKLLMAVDKLLKKVR
jgi:hypothetical protein